MTARRWAWLGPPVVLGAVLRLWGCARQVLGDDELHALQIALKRPLGEILTQYSREVDHCVPLTALLRLGIEGGLAPSEMMLRAPVLLAGLLIVPVLALTVERALGTRVASAFAWLAAVSPLLVLYARILRSYTPMVLLALVAVFALYHWVQEGRRRDALLFAVCAPLAVWFHLVVAPLVAGAFAWVLATRRWQPRPPSARALLWLTAGTAAVLGLLFLPLGSSLVAFAARKSEQDVWDWQSVWGSARLHAGVASPVLAVLFWGVVGCGALRLWRARPVLLGYLGWIALAQLAGLYLVRPVMVSHLLVLNRYALPLLPLALVLVACAFGLESRGRRRRVGPGLCALFVTLFVAAGPLVRERFVRGSFAHHNLALAFVRDDSALVRETAQQASGVYRRLAADETSHAIVEFPTDWRWPMCNAAVYLQAVHGKEVVVSTGLELYADPRLRLRNAVTPTPEALLASRGDYLVVHLDPGAEEERYRPAGERAEFWGTMGQAALAFEGVLRARWGEPDLADAGVVAWDLRGRR